MINKNIATLALVLLIGASSVGCSDSSGPKIYAPPAPDYPTLVPGSWQNTPLGVRVWVPIWLDLFPVLKSDSFVEIDTAKVPLYIEVHIQDPGLFSTQSGALASGQTDMFSWIAVAFRRIPNSRPLLPALIHEMAHITTGDPLIGHTKEEK